MLITSVKKVFRSEVSQWSAENAPSGEVPIVNRIAIMNLLNAIIFFPLLILGLLFCAIYFYKRIRKKDKGKSIKWFKRGTVAIIIYTLLYIILLVVEKVVFS